MKTLKDVAKALRFLKQESLARAVEAVRERCRKGFCSCTPEEVEHEGRGRCVYFQECDRYGYPPGIYPSLSLFPLK